MTMTIEKKLRNFRFWGGATTNATKLTSDELDQLEAEIEGWRCGDVEPWSINEINDMMWFNFEQVCEILGLDYEEVMARE